MLMDVFVCGGLGSLELNLPAGASPGLWRFLRVPFRYPYIFTFNISEADDFLSHDTIVLNDLIFICPGLPS